MDLSQVIGPTPLALLNCQIRQPKTASMQFKYEKYLLDRHKTHHSLQHVVHDSNGLSVAALLHLALLHLQSAMAVQGRMAEWKPCRPTTTYALAQQALRHHR